MKELHEIKIQILKELLYSNSKRYSDLKPIDMEGSQFSFHLNDLVNQNLIKKINGGDYALTLEGKNFAGKYDYDSDQPSIQAKHSVVVCVFRNNRTEILLYTRFKSPFYGCQGFMTGKVQYGEKVQRAAKRELLEETHLIGNPEIKAIRHFRVYDFTSKNLVEDKVMYIHVVDNPKGNLQSNDEGKFEWIDLGQVKNFIVNPLEEFEEIFQIITSEKYEWIKEIDQYTSKF